MTLPPAIAPLRCNNPDCTFSEGGVCARSAEHVDPIASCPDLVRLVPVAAQVQTEDGAPLHHASVEGPLDESSTAAAGAPASGAAAPWSGRHMSEAEIDRLMGRSPARVLGIVGPFGAGKTCLLVSFFLLLADGQCAQIPYRFAASRTLFAFQTFGHELGQWDGRAEGQMVSHTPSTDREERGAFLHLGLRPRDPSDDRLVDLLLCDIAGEHFSELARLANDTTRARMAFVHRCDAFVLVVDGPALLGDRGRQLDTELARMLGRLIDLIQEKKTTPLFGATRPPPVALAITKADLLTPAERDVARSFIHSRAPRLARSLQRALDHQIHCETFLVSAIPAEAQPQGVQELFGHLLQHVDRRDPWPPICVSLPDEPFHSFLAHRWRDA